MTKYYKLRALEPSKCSRGSFRTDDIGHKGGHLRIACRVRGRWATQAYRLPKNEWRKYDDTLIPVSPSAERMRKRLKGRIVAKGRGDDYRLVK